MYFTLVGIISPFIVIGIKGDEINKTQKISGIFLLILIYLIGLGYF